FYAELTAINDNTWKSLCKLVEFPDNTASLVKIGNIIPYQNFQFLWDKNSRIKPLFKNNNTLSSNFKLRMDLSRSLKELKFNSETRKIEFKASLSNPAINWKEIKKLASELKKTTN